MYMSYENIKGEISIGHRVVRMSPIDLSNFSRKSLTYFKFLYRLIAAHSLLRLLCGVACII